MPNVRCPSGLTGQVRKLKALEANALADESNRQKEEALDGVLRTCWLETYDPGPYTLKNGVLDWGSVLVADRYVAIVDLRIATYGTAYDLKLPCEGADCRQRFAWHIDLERDLPRIALPEESIRTFAKDNRFAGHFHGAGRDFVFKLQDGNGERAVAKTLKLNRGRRLTVAIASRILEIEGVDSNDKLRFVDALDMDDLAGALEQMDAVDGGIETKIEVQCEHCGLTQEVMLPLGKDFWFPIRKPPRSDTTSSPGA